MPAKPNTIADYIATLADAQKKPVKELLTILKSTSSALEETLNYGTPALKLNGKLAVGVAAAKTHTGFYVMSETVMQQFKKELAEYDTAKTSVRFPVGDPLPAALIKKIMLARMKEIKQ